MTEHLDIAVLETLCLTSGLLLRYVPFKKIVDKKTKKILFAGYIIAMLLNAIAMSFIFTNIGQTMTFIELDMFVFSAITVLWNICIIRKHIREHLFVFGLVLTCNYLILSIPVYLIEGLILNSYILTPAWILITGCIIALFYWPIRTLLKRTVEPFLFLTSGNYWNTMWFIPIAQFFSMMLAFPNDVVSTTLSHILGNAFAGSVIILMCLSVAKDHQRMEEQIHMKNQLNDQKLYYAQIQQRIEDTRAQRHDYKHHLAVIQRFIDTDDKQGLQEYCNHFFERNGGETPIPYTGNAAADGVVYRYMQLARKNNVDFQYSGKIKNGRIADMDLCVLLGNALDNAMTGCLTVEENRSISLISQTEEQMLSIVVHNSFDGTVKQENETFLSRKRDHKPGVGMQSMRAVCNQYGGTMQTQWTEDTFTVLFVLPTGE